MNMHLIAVAIPPEMRTYGVPRGAGLQAGTPTFELWLVLETQMPTMR